VAGLDRELKEIINMSRKGRRIARGFAMLALIVVVLGGVGFIVLLLWNTLVPPLFHGPVLQYWQAVGLLVLSRILFGGLRVRGGHGHWRGRHWRERWEQLSPEERAQLRERFAGRCGRVTPAAPAAGG
jgi:hypothetical protein